MGSGAEDELFALYLVDYQSISVRDFHREAARRFISKERPLYEWLEPKKT